MPTHTYYLYNRLVDRGIHPEKVFLIPNGVDEARFSNDQIPPNHQVLLDTPVILYLGDLNISSGHSVNLLIRAVPHIRKKQGLEDTVLLMVGDGKDEAVLKKLANDLKITEAVIWVGRVPPQSVPGYMKLANVLVDPVYPHPGNLSRCPLKILEAAYFGIPVVTSDYGDRQTLIPEGCEFVAEGDSMELARGISRILLMDHIQLSEKIIKLQKHGHAHGWRSLGRKFEKILSSLNHDGHQMISELRHRID